MGNKVKVEINFDDSNKSVKTNIVINGIKFNKFKDIPKSIRFRALCECDHLRSKLMDSLV